MPPADGWTEAPSGGHVAAPRALPPRAACADRGPFRTPRSGAAAGAGAGQCLGRCLGGVFLARIGERGKGGCNARRCRDSPGIRPEGGAPSTEKGRRQARASG